MAERKRTNGVHLTVLYSCNETEKVIALCSKLDAVQRTLHALVEFGEMRRGINGKILFTGTDIT